MRRTYLIALVAVVSLLGVSCSNGDEGGSEASPAAEAETSTSVEIKAFEFVPSELDVSVGDVVEWTNEDDILHTVTSGIGQEQGAPGVSENVDAQPDGMFDEEVDGVGATFSFTFEEAGTYEYYCAIHPGMTGTINVE